MPRDTYAVWQARGVVTFDAGVTLAERFRSHMGHSSTLYGYAMRGMADDWEAGGPVREICRGWEDSPTGTMVQLRFLAAVFRIVLDGRAPELDPFYPCLGGEADAAGAWPVMHQVIAEHAEKSPEPSMWCHKPTSRDAPQCSQWGSLRQCGGTAYLACGCSKSAPLGALTCMPTGSATSGRGGRGATRSRR
ncbi:MAG: DUF2332 family protein [Actinomycetales bacterium]|nr:DUF2332 family protein [Actinomycetales bacterium]